VLAVPFLLSVPPLLVAVVLQLPLVQEPVVPVAPFRLLPVLVQPVVVP
jgi:hypothetical protein